MCQESTAPEQLAFHRDMDANACVSKPHLTISRRHGRGFLRPSFARLRSQPRAAV